MYFDNRLNTALSRLIIEAAITTEQQLAVLRKSNTVFHGSNNNKPLSQYSDQELMQILEQVHTFFAAHAKFIPYIVYQIAKGNCNPHYLAEDRYRIIKVISDFQAVSRKANWTQSRNIYDFDSWRELEAEIDDFKNEQISSARYAVKKDVDSQILYTKTYVNKNQLHVAKLLGLPLTEAPWVQYWLRKILTPLGAYTYGRGTHWCTSTDPAKCEPGTHPATPYLRRGLYVIERASNDTPRSPIVQISDDQVMNKKDEGVGVGGFARTLYQFMMEIMQNKELPIDASARDAIANRLIQ